MQPLGPQGVLAKCERCVSSVQRSEAPGAVPASWGFHGTLFLGTEMCAPLFWCLCCVTFLASEREWGQPRQPRLGEAQVVSEHPGVWAHRQRLGLCGHTGRDLRLGCGIWSHTYGFGPPPAGALFPALRPTPRGICHRPCSALSPEEEPCFPSHWPVKNVGAGR